MAATDKSQGIGIKDRIPYEISWWQLAMLFVCHHLSITVSYTPTISGSLPPVRDTWLAALLAWIPGFISALIAWWLAKRFEGQNVYELTKTILGRYLGTFVNVVFVVYLLYWTTLVTREFAVFTASVVYVQTPEFVFSILFVLIALVGASRHIEFVGRAAELAAPFFIGGLILLLVGLIPDVDIGRLRPVLAEGWQGVLRQALTPAAYFAEAGWVALLAMPYLNNLKDGPKALGTGFGVNVAFVTLAAVMFVGVFGPELLSLMAFPTFSAARVIRFGTFLERVEWPLLVLWVGAMGVRVSLLLLGARIGISSLFPRVRTGYVLMFVSVVVFVGSLYIAPTLGHVLDLFTVNSIFWPQLPAQTVPLVLAAVAVVRGVGADRS